VRTLAIALLACLATGASAAAADLEANKALIRSYYEEMWNKHQPSAAHDAWEPYRKAGLSREMLS
jgi:hypothetical protein